VGETGAIGKHSPQVLHQPIEHVLRVVVPGAVEEGSDVEFASGWADEGVVDDVGEGDCGRLKGEVVKTEGELELAVLVETASHEDNAIPDRWIIEGG
jgi:hypothetical protein